MECWKEEITEKWLDRKLFLYVLCCTYFFKCTHLSPGAFSFFESDLQYCVSPPRILCSCIYTDKLRYQRWAKNNHSFTFILSSVLWQTLPPLSQFLSLSYYFFCPNNTFMFSWFSALSGFQSPHKAPAPFLTVESLGTTLSSQLFRHLNEREVFQGGSGGRDHGQVAGLRNHCMSVHLVLLLFSLYPVF